MLSVILSTMCTWRPLLPLQAVEQLAQLEHLQLSACPLLTNSSSDLEQLLTRAGAQLSSITLTPSSSLGSRQLGSGPVVLRRACSAPTALPAMCSKDEGRA
jgi:hypothetical protein